MADPEGKILRDYQPSPSSLQGGQEFRMGDAPTPDYATDSGQGAFDAQRGSKSEEASPIKNNLDPFPVSLITTQGTPDTYEVTVGWGYVCERIPGAGDAVAYHPAANMMDGGALRKFAIPVGEAVYIRVEVDQDGIVSPPPEEDAVTIVVSADVSSSSHYTPRVGDPSAEGSAGFMLYKLAKLVAAVPPSTTPTLEKWLTGSHIDHYQELPAILSTIGAGAGIGVIPKEWNNSSKAYRLRAISKGFGKNTITTNSEHVEVRGTMKDGQIIVYYGPTEDSYPLAEWSDGYLSTGTTIIGDGSEDPVPEADIKPLYIPTVEHWDHADRQINVTNLTTAPKKQYLVRGNGKFGKRTLRDAEGYIAWEIEWKDGLVISEYEEEYTDQDTDYNYFP